MGEWRNGGKGEWGNGEEPISGERLSGPVYTPLMRLPMYDRGT